MNRIIIIILLFQSIGFAQSPEDLFNKSLEFSDERNYIKAIELLDEFIQKYPNAENIHKIYLNRATAKSRNNDYEGAYIDYTTAFSLDSTYAEAIRQRGFLYKKMHKYELALKDYNFALKIDSSLTTTYINKAFLYQEKGDIENACKNYEIALERGITDYVGNMIKLCDTTSLAYQKYTYKILVEKATDSTYGHTPENPIKVGGSPKNQSAFLQLLRDAQGNKIIYKRIGVSAHYQSDNGLLGQASVDNYKVDYKDKNGKSKSDNLYLSFYDYEQPKIPVGFYNEQDFN
jgi:tetratricopeptide (TPR) repeat protein